MAQPKILFITGVGRSGTSLLQSMLNAHPQINIPPETHFFKSYIVPYLLFSKRPDKEKLERDRYLKRLSNGMRSNLLNSLSAEGGDLKSAFVGVMAGESPVAVAGDKDTEYVRYLPHLKRAFPDAFLLHIKRDPRDVIASRKKAEWSKGQSVAFHAAEYQYYIRKVEKEGRALFQNHYQDLRYEDLLLSPEQTLKPILQKLGLVFSDTMLQFHQNSQTLVADDEKAWKQNLNKPILKDNIAKWKTELTENEIGLIQNGLEDFFKANSYSIENTSVSSWELIKRKAYKFMFKGKTFKEQLR